MKVSTYPDTSDLDCGHPVRYRYSSVYTAVTTR